MQKAYRYGFNGNSYEARAQRALVALLGVNFHCVEYEATGTSGEVSTGPTVPQASAGAASAHQSWNLLKFEAAGGANALKRLTDLTSRASFGAKSAASQAARMGKVAGLSKLAKVASSAGTVANLLNAASFAYHVNNCWHP
jgi:hypothetical protein